MDDRYKIIVQGAKVTNLPEKPPNPLRRPEIRYGKMLLAAAVYLAVTVLLCILFREQQFSVIVPVCLCWTGIYFCIIGDRAVIWLVHVYQKHAPDHVRLRCLFYPSCSEYMILSVKKYGLFRGVFKGINRLLRCHSPNGGIDEP